MQVKAIRRTNSLLVIARPVDIATIKDLVAKLDQEASDTNYLERKLKYMPVTEFLEVAKDALSQGTDIDSEGGSSGGSAGGSAPKSRTSKRTSNTPSTDANMASRNNNQYNGGMSGGYGGGMGGGSIQHGSLDEPEAPGAPVSVVVGKTFMVANSRSNTLIVNGSPEDILKVDKLIERLDVRPQQIYISTIIGQLNLGNQYDYGIDFLKTLDDFTFRRQQDGTGTGTGRELAPALGQEQAPGSARVSEPELQQASHCRQPAHPD